MRKYNDRRRGFRSRTSAGDVTLIIAACLFGVMLVSNLILEIITISEVGRCFHPIIRDGNPFRKGGEEARLLPCWTVP